MRDKLFAMIAGICYFEESDMHPGLSIADDLAVTSVMIVEIIAMVEREWGVNLEEHVGELVGCAELGEMTDLIEGLCKESGGPENGRDKQ